MINSKSEMDGNPEYYDKVVGVASGDFLSSHSLRFVKPF